MRTDWVELKTNGKRLLGRYRKENGIVRRDRKGHAQTLAAFHQSAAVEPSGRFHKIISWNLLHLAGASSDDLVRLIERERPDLLLMQEATHAIDDLPDRVGGHYARTPLPGCVHGLAMWSPTRLANEPVVFPLPAGTIISRICQAVDLGDFAVGNVHLSHGQVLNRRQLRRIAQVLPQRAAVLGDYNLVGPALLPGFRDVGPRFHTHVMGDIVPIRIDRCLVRGLACLDRAVLPRERSDHRPIMVRLAVAQPLRHAA